MARNKGTFPFSANFEVKAKAPLDARVKVDNLADLIDASIWKDSNNLTWLYNGLLVSVSNDNISSSNNGVYFLKDETNYTNISSWEKLGSSTSDSSINIWNGLAKTDSSIGLGGILNTDISINLNNNSLTFINTDSSILIIDGSSARYGKDLSNNFTDRSLVDKSYVDNKFGEALKGYEGTIVGDDITKEFSINHNLNTIKQSITVYDVNGLVVYPDLQRGANTDIITFSTAPVLDTIYYVVILGFLENTSKSYTETIYGNDVSTSFLINHNLNTLHQIITTFDNITGSIVYPDLQRGINTDIITYELPPETGESYSIVILGF